MTGPTTPAQPRPLPRFLPLAVVLAGIVAFVVFLVRGILIDPAVVMLLPKDGAEWVKPPTETRLYMNDPQVAVALYRATVDIDAAGPSLEIRVTALRRLQVVLDGVTIYEEPNDRFAWKPERTVVLPPDTRPGTHSMLFVVTNDVGPPAVRIASDDLGIRSNTDWQCSTDGANWTRAWPVSRVEPPWVATTLPPPTQQFLDLASLLSLVFAVGAFGAWLATRPTGRARRLMAVITPSKTRYAIQIALLVLGIHVRFVANEFNGADSVDHYQYVHWFTENFALPDVSDGKQLFQAPLFYAISALLHLSLTPFFEHDWVDKAIRIVPVLCGLGIVEVSFRMLRNAFPGDRRVQFAGILAISFTPLLIFKTQFVGNEALVAVLASATILALLRFVDPSRQPGHAPFAIAGAIWGLACLAKVSALVLAPPILLVLGYWWYSRRSGVRVAVLRVGVFALAFVVVCGWFYAANYARYGKPVIGGWSPEVGYEWWQPPGYRSPDQYLSFGRGLVHPVFASVYGFWDAMYAGLWFDAELSGVVNRVNHPKWDYRFAESALLWAILPTLAIGVGALRSVWPAYRERAEDSVASHAHFTRVLSLWVVGVYGASILGHSFLLPYYSPLKASYALSALPCASVLLALGLEPLTRCRVTTALLSGWIAVWAALVYTAYWSIAP